MYTLEVRAFNPNSGLYGAFEKNCVISKDFETFPTRIKIKEALYNLHKDKMRLSMVEAIDIFEYDCLLKGLPTEVIIQLNTTKKMFKVGVRKW